VPTGFFATTGGTTGGAAALSAVAHAVLIVAAVVGVHGADAASTGEKSDVAVTVEEIPIEAPKDPVVAPTEDRPQPTAPAPRLRESRIEQRAAGASTTASDTPAAPPVVATTSTPSAHFAMTVNAVEPTSTSVTTAAPLPNPVSPAPAAPRGARARRVAFVEPKYTPEALAAGIEGEVGLEIVVSETGAFVSARITRRLGYGLDEAALAAVARWRFEPYRDADGRAAAVRMPWPVQFRLQ
jgi:TonB family protein